MIWTKCLSILMVAADSVNILPSKKKHEYRMLIICVYIRALLCIRGKMVFIVAELLVVHVYVWIESLLRFELRMRSLCVVMEHPIYTRILYET